MTKTTLKALIVTAVMGLGALSLPATAQAGHGWGGGPGFWGAGLIGLGVGAVVGSALAAPVYVGPPYVGPPPPPGAYAPAAYAGPPAWTPEWYTYCAQRYRSFNAHSGYFTGYDGQPYFCQ
ncbi:MAG: BA14K family protein [Methyloceanibacter sp.]